VPLLAGGCAPVGPNYKRVAVPTPAHYRFAETIAETESLADAPWWQVFQDPTLQALIREAIANNLDLQAAVGRVKEARARAGVAKSFLYPQLDGSAAYTFQRASSSSQTDQIATPGQTDRNARADEDEDTSGSGVNHGGIYGVPLSWQLDFFGRIRREHEAAFATFLASEQGRRGVMVTLVGDVATNYFSSASSISSCRSPGRRCRTTINWSRSSETAWKAGWETGSSSIAPWRSARRRLRRFPTSNSGSPSSNRRSRCCSGACRRHRPPAAPSRRDCAAGDPAGLPASLLERRPDVVQAEQRWWRPTPTSARRRRCSFRTSA
jgi:multidrug efflux system outer membrane protein